MLTWVPFDWLEMFSERSDIFGGSVLSALSESQTATWLATTAIYFILQNFFLSAIGPPTRCPCFLLFRVL